MKSDNVKKGMQQAPHRSLFNALGFTEEEMNKPMVGIVSSYNEIVPGHMNLDKIVNAVKLGVAEAGGVPVVFPAIAVNKFRVSDFVMMAIIILLCATCVLPFLHVAVKSISGNTAVMSTSRIFFTISIPSMMGMSISDTITSWISEKKV